MPHDIKADYSDHGKVLVMIEKAQDAEQDQREYVNEAKRFVTERGGQWDSYAVTKLDGRFRGEFDMCEAIVDGIAGEIEQADFTIRVAPAGGQATKANAKTLDGLIRNIRNISNAENTFNKAGRSNVIGGFDCWEVVQDYIDGDTFEQDLFIRQVPNAANSVWFDLSSVLQDRSDANWAIKLAKIPVSEYRARFPEGSGMSIGDNSEYNNSHSHKFNSKETVTIGKLYYRKPIKIDLVMMDDGSVYRDDDKFEKVRDDLARQGINIAVNDDGEEMRRERDSWVVYSRLLDGSVWLAEEEETVFDFIPLIPIYGNFDIVDSRVIYYGKIEKLYDAQRTLNYAFSRDIEDGALSPSPTVWMTDAMAEGNDYSAMNTDRDPVRIFNVDPEAPDVRPQYAGGPQQSTGLQTTIANMQQMIMTTSNTFAAQQGNANAQQSGVAGLQQIEQGNIGNMKWFKALEVAICHTGKVLINAIPKVYDSTRQARILNEDGTDETIVLNQPVVDAETGEVVILNDLSIGEYDVVCEMGPAFNSQQKEAARSFETMASVAPQFAQMGLDIWSSNKKEPGMDKMAERFREQYFNAGLIPESQWTPEETERVREQQAQAAQQPPQEDPAMVAARAEVIKGQAEQTKAQNEQLEIQIKAQQLQLEAAKIQAARQGQVEKLESETQLNLAKVQQGAVKLEQDQQKIDFEQLMKVQQQQAAEQKQQFEQVMKAQDQQLQINQALVENINKQADTLKVLREAIGADAVITPANTEAYEQQTEEVIKAQDKTD